MKIPITRRWLVFLVACLSFVLSQFYRSSVAVISPNLIADLGLDAAGLSLVSAAFFYSFAVMQIPVALYLDRIGPRFMMAGLTLVAVGGALLFAMGNSLAMLVLGRVLIGAGMACNLMGSLKLITLWFGPTRFATLSALVLSIGTAGNIVSATPLVLLVEIMGWRATFVMFAVVTFLVVVLFVLVVRDRPPDAVTSFENSPPAPLTGEALTNIRRLFVQKDFWIISFGTFSRYGVFAAVQALWAGPYLMKALQVSAVDTGNMLFLMSIGLIIGSPVFGYLSDATLYSRKIPICVGFIGKVVILVVLARLRPGASLMLLSLLFFGFGFFTSAGPIMYAHIKERMPLEMAGAAMTGVNFFTMAGVAVFLQVLASLMQRLFPEAALGSSAFETAFYFCAANLALAALLYLFTRETLVKGLLTGQSSVSRPVAESKPRIVVNRLRFKTNDRTILAHLKSKADGESGPSEFSLNSIRQQPDGLALPLTPEVRALSIMNAERPSREIRSTVDDAMFQVMVENLFEGQPEKSSSQEIAAEIATLRQTLESPEKAGEVVDGWTRLAVFEQALLNYQAVGFFTQYDWALSQWGCPGDIQSVEPETFVSPTGCLSFTSAWSPPVLALQELANLFPSVRFRLDYRYEDSEEWELIEFFPLMPWGY